MTEFKEHSQREMTEFKEHSQREMEAFKAEMRESREHSQREMAAFIDQSQREMAAFKAEMRESREQSQREMAEFKAGMEVFKAEMQKAREDSDKKMQAFRQELGGVSNRLGRIVEDFVAPSIPALLPRLVGKLETLERVCPRVQSRVEGRKQEYDLLVVYGDYLLINETKSNLGAGEVRDFLEVLREVRTFLPEYRDKKIIGTMASLLIEPSVLSFGQKNGLVMLGLVGELMQVLNDADFSPTLF
jgi:hypothetical protein